MQHTLVAVFDNRSDAQNAMDELLGSGFSRSDVNVSSADPTGQTSSLTGSSGLADETHEEGIGASIKHFFTGLFGSDSDEHASRYSDAVTRGHHVLTVTTQSEPEVERAADVIERFGPVDIDERHDLNGPASSLDAGMLAAGASAGSGLQGASMQSGMGSVSTQGMAPGTQPGSLQGGADSDRNFFATQNLNDPVPQGQTFQEPMGGNMQAGGSLDSALGGNVLSGTQSSSLNSGLSNSQQTSQGGSLSQSDAMLQGTASLPGSSDASLGGTIQSTQSTLQGSQTGSQLGNQQRDTAAIPVVQEELKVGKREVSRGGVRVYSRVVETPVSESVNLREEHVNVERRPVDQPISAADATAFKEQSIELRETAEEAVVQKSARVVEEVLVGKEVSQREQQISDTVRHTEVQVENLPGDTSLRTSGAMLNDDSAFRSDWQSNYASQGGSYDDYAPAYQYGTESRSKYQGRNFDDVENDLRSDWDTRYGKGGASSWEQFKAAVRHGWDKITPDMDGGSHRA
jgi:uncharacterized protein (TIGR02271 family)